MLQNMINVKVKPNSNLLEEQFVWTPVRFLAVNVG